ncbi:MAG TPA: hypothetical protein VGR02_13375 [Thermoanaerobaculia bacterium]|nr:hypothetical protein [Thermoanaerobaculia bacterium]
MRTSIAAVLAVILMSGTAVAQSVTSDELLQRGKDNFRAGHYNEAVSDLKAASDTYLAPEQKQQYVATGHLPSLPKLEEAFIYLTMAYNRLGRDEDARDTIARLLTAERIEPIYTKLQLEADAAEFERLAADLAPQMRVPANEQLARGGAPVPAPATQVAETTPPPPAPTIVIPAPTAVAEATPAPTPAPTTTPAPTPTPAAPTPAPTQVATAAPGTQPLPVQPTMAQERAEIMRLIDERVAEARKQIEQAAEQRIAAERAAAQKAADERVAAAQQAADRRIAEERAAAQKAADERVAAAQQATEQRIASERAAAEQRIATERAAAERAAQERIATERAAAERAAQERIAAAEADARRNVLTSLRQAESFAAADQLPRANEIYNRLIDAPNVSRDALAAVATGLYRTGDFRGAARAFQRLGTFAKGEEDLRYYNAVALYETGQYDQAKKELACALPFIQVTNDVSRYRAKIEQTPSQQAMK